MSHTNHGYPRVLIVMTAPFNNGGSSRTLDSYFHYWDKRSVAQIYSRNCDPTKGHCATYYQITDERLVKRWLGSTELVGRVFRDDELADSDELKDEFVNTASKSAYALGAKHTPSIELLRGLLWRKRFWCTRELVNWLDKFKPECVLYNFSNHLFTQEIALFVASRFDIPIIPVIGDDYYFNDRPSPSPTYHLFRHRFKKLTERIMAQGVNAVYCSEKCQAKYGNHFGLDGAPIYISSSLKRREFRSINRRNPKFLYCGSVKLGRNLALVEIADALKSIDPAWMLDVYTSDTDETVCKPLLSHSNINFGGQVGYERVVELISECDVFVIAEGFRDKDLLFTRYSLSTKAADGLASGAALLVYGPKDAGVVEYMAQSGAAAVCSDKDSIKQEIEALIDDERLQREMYSAAQKLTAANHTIESSTKTFKTIVNSALISYGVDRG